MSRVRRQLAVFGVAIAAGAVLTVPHPAYPVDAARVEDGPGAAGVRTAPPGGTRRLTLPTGDRLAVAPGDSLEAIGYDQAGSPGTWALHRFRRHGERYAIPATAVQKVAGGQSSLDGFNVDRLLGKRTGATGRSAAADPATYHLSVTIFDRSGLSENPYASFSNLDTGEAGWFAMSGDTLELPAGRYAVLSFADLEAGANGREYSVYGIRELRLDADASLTVDHRRTSPVTLNLDNQLAIRGVYGVGFGQVLPDVGLIDSMYLSAYFPETRIYAGAQAAAGSSPGLRFYTRATIEQKAVDLRITAPERFDVRAIWMGGSPRVALTASLPVAYAGRGSQTEVAAAGVGGKLVLIDIPYSAGSAEVPPIVATVARQGGRFVALRFVDDLPAPIAARRAAMGGANDATLALPTAMLEGLPAEDRLVALATAGPVRAALTTLPASPFRYQLGYVDRDGAVTTTRFVRTTDLAEVPVADYGAGQAEVYADAYFLPGTPDALGGGLGYTHPSPGRRTEYYSPGPWSLSVVRPVAGPFWWDSLSATVNLAQGMNPPIAWNKAVAGPSVRGSTSRWGISRPWAERQGNVIDVLLPMYTDGAGHSRLAGFVRGEYFGQPGVTRLYRGKALVGELPQAGIGTFEVFEAADTYRLFAEATAADASWPLSTRVTAEWTFQSAASSSAMALPLMAVRYAPNLDLTNAAPASRSLIIPVTVERQDGTPDAALAALTIEMSTDDGATWQRPVAVATKNGVGQLTVMNPGSGYVSLRAKATDSAGNSVTQTIIRAYQVRDPQDTQKSG